MSKSKETGFSENPPQEKGQESSPPHKPTPDQPTPDQLNSNQPSSERSTSRQFRTSGQQQKQERNEPEDGGPEDESPKAAGPGDGKSETSGPNANGSARPDSRGRLVWRSALPKQTGQWCVRFIFHGGSYGWWTVGVTEKGDSFYVLEGSGKNVPPVPVSEYPVTEKIGQTQWAGPIEEPWDNEGISLRHCDGCGKMWIPGGDTAMRICSRLVCCADCWEKIPLPIRVAFLHDGSAPDEVSPEEEAIRSYLIARRRKDG